MRKRLAGIVVLLVGLGVCGSSLTGCSKKEEELTPSTSAKGTPGSKLDSPNASGANTGATGSPMPSGR